MCRLRTGPIFFPRTYELNAYVSGFDLESPLHRMNLMRLTTTVCMHGIYVHPS